MSTPVAIASVTWILQQLLIKVDKDITTKPPAAARGERKNEQLNLFLYATHVNTAFSNSSVPGQVRSGESGTPPLALVLKYLLTAYAGDDDISDQKLMGQAMSVFHDHPVLGQSDFKDLPDSPWDSDLQNQIERLRITPDVLSLDDMSKLWSSFQAEYRLSTGYEVSVVLIESTRAGRAPLPVLKRGDQNQGAHVLATSSPVLSGLRFANQKPGAELGDLVTIFGEQLASDDIAVRFRHPLLDAPIEIQPEEDRSQTEIHVQLPGQGDDPEVGSKWPAGFYTLSLVVQKPDIPVWTTNELALPLAPQITSISPTTAPAGDITLTIECIPQVRDDQRIALIFGDRAVPPDNSSTPADPTAPSTLTFTVANAEARTEPYVLRLRVDGVDSIPVDFSGDTPRFADDQKVTIT
jgi:hypothetical protein